MPTIEELKQTSAYKNHKSIRGKPKSKMKKQELLELVQEYQKNKNKGPLLPIPEKKSPVLKQKDPEKLTVAELKKTKIFLDYPGKEKKFFTKEQILTFLFNRNQDFVDYFKINSITFQENPLYSDALNDLKRKRIEDFNHCKKKVDGILNEKDKWKVCVSGPSKMNKKLTYLGKGSFGIVNKFVENNCEIVVKEVGMKNEDFVQATKKHYLTEFTFMKMFSEDVNFCFFIPLIYGIGFCNSCDNKICSVFFMELFDSDAKGDFSDLIFVSSVFMLLDALFYLQKNYGFVHYDIKLVNVLVKKDFSKKGSILFKQFPKIKNYGYTFYLSDFGVSTLFRPSKIFNRVKGSFDYGCRLMQIDTDNKASPLYFSNTIEYGKNSMTLKPSKPLNWSDTSEFGSRTCFSSKFPMEKMGGPNIDLNDMVKYPEANFFNDICDVFKSYIGGKRSTQQGNHHSVIQSKLLRDIFAYWNYDNVIKYTISTPMIHKEYLFRADLAQKYFYYLLLKQKIIDH